MSLFPCSGCEKKSREKMANVTWAWQLADGRTRSAWRQRLCTDCFILRVMPLQEASADNPWSCPACHSDPGDDLDPIYCTAYVPGVGKIQLELATDSVCAIELRNSAQQNAQHLESEPPSVGAAAPTLLPSATVWASLGIVPRDG